MKKLSIINKLIFLFNSITLILLILSYISPYINPNVFSPIAFLGLLFPILYLLNIAFLIYWLIIIKKQIWMNIIILLIGFQYLDKFISFNGKKETNEANETNNTIKILSYNVRLFNAYKWMPNLKKETIFNFLKKENADIMCIQEFYTNKNLPNFNYKFKHIGLQSKKENWHMAIYSNYPQIKNETLTIKGNNINNTCIYSDIVVLKDTIRIYNIHLASNWFKSSDYSFIKKPERKNMKNRIKGIIKSMKKSYKKRAEEVLIIKEHMNTSPYPIIICGDFNDTPLSFCYNKIKGTLIDSFVSSGNGIGQSFIGIPALRIDYILHDKKMKSKNYTQHKQILSDHFAISCNIKL